MEDALAHESGLNFGSIEWVLILVVMEDALAQSRGCSLSVWKLVLILVVMEDALAQTKTVDKLGNQRSLNPCCNGRCTRTAKLGLCFV